MASEDHRYFLQLEESFLQLRGAPLVLSPADWKLAREWRSLGIPTHLVIGVFEEAFEKHAERGDGRRVNGFRYCAAAVRKAWREQAELLGATVTAQDSPESGDADHEDSQQLLESLAERLPDEWVGSSEFRAKVLEVGGSVSEIEASLIALDVAMIDLAWSTLDDLSKVAVESDVAERGAGISGRGEGLRSRLRSQVLRKRLGLPRLSLFAFLN